MPSVSEPTDTSPHIGGGLEACCVICRGEINIPFQHRARAMDRYGKETPDGCLYLVFQDTLTGKNVYALKTRCALLALYLRREQFE